MSKVLDTRSGMKGNGRVANPKLYPWCTRDCWKWRQGLAQQ